MKIFSCSCGQQIYFDNTHCVACKSELGFDPVTGDMYGLERAGDNSYVDGQGTHYKRCRNGIEYNNCNWLLGSNDDSNLCWGCSFNRTIPNLQYSENLERWRLFEQAKKRLLYTLLDLGLPLVNGFVKPGEGLILDFIEDGRSNPDIYRESFAYTGHSDGVITINALEADDLARENARVSMNEKYRTLLGHLRHESGHYYWERFKNDSFLEKFTELFGDYTQDYQSSLDQYYQQPPCLNWEKHYISAYASAHPWEDWAETWGHYLFIYDTLQTILDLQFSDFNIVSASVDERINEWLRISAKLNELGRSSGSGDFYPFIISVPVKEKLVFVGSMIEAYIREETVVSN